MDPEPISNSPSQISLTGMNQDPKEYESGFSLANSRSNQSSDPTETDNGELSHLSTSEQHGQGVEDQRDDQLVYDELQVEIGVHQKKGNYITKVTPADPQERNYKSCSDVPSIEEIRSQPKQYLTSGQEYGNKPEAKLESVMTFAELPALYGCEGDFSDDSGYEKKGVKTNFRGVPVTESGQVETLDS